MILECGYCDHQGRPDLLAKRFVGHARCTCCGRRGGAKVVVPPMASTKYRQVGAGEWAGFMALGLFLLIAIILVAVGYGIAQLI